MKTLLLYTVVWLAIASVAVAQPKTPVITKIDRVSTNADEYAPFELHNRLFFSRSDISADGGDTISSSVLIRSDSLVDGVKYELITNIGNVQSELTGHGSLYIDGDIGLVSIYNTEEERYEAKGVEFKQGARSIEFIDLPLADRINSDFSGSFYSHFCFIRSRFVFLASDKRELVNSEGETLASKGGYDIWYYVFIRDRNKWFGPYNMSDVNTAGDEVSPIIDINRESLFFSSNSTQYEGQGGFDIYHTSRIPEQRQYQKLWESIKATGFTFTAPKNLDVLESNNIVKINSRQDDLFYFRIDQSQAFYCSDHENNGQSGLDIFHITPIPYVPPGHKSVIQFIDCNDNPIPDINVVAEYEVGNRWQEIQDMNTGLDGIVRMKLERGEYQFTVKDDDLYSSAPLRVTQEMAERARVHQVRLPRRDDGSVCPDTVKLIVEFNVDSWTPQPQYIDTLNKYVPVVREFMEKFPNSYIYIAGHTDRTASIDHNCELSLNRATAIFEYLKKRIDAMNFKNSKILHYGECRNEVDEIQFQNASPAMLKEIRQKNRRVEVLLLPYYYPDLESDCRCAEF